MNDNKNPVPVPSENIEEIYTKLYDLEQTAIKDMVINQDMIDNFDNCAKILKWQKYYNEWNRTKNGIEHEYKRIKSIRYFIIKDSNIYNMSEKEILLKMEADPIIISYKNCMDALELVLAFIQKIESLLDNQRYDIKEKFNYMRWVNGEDF